MYNHVCFSVVINARLCYGKIFFYFVLAVLLENFSIFYNDEETNLDLETMKDFKRKWRIFDLHARVIKLYSACCNNVLDAV